MPPRKTSFFDSFFKHLAVVLVQNNVRGISPPSYNKLPRPPKIAGRMYNKKEGNRRERYVGLH